MLNKIYKYIKENLVMLIILLVIIVLALIPTPYEVYAPGGLIDMNNRIKIDNEDEDEGTFNLTYVSAKKGNVFALLASYLIPTWDIVKIEESQIETEDYDEIVTRNQILLKEGVSASTYVAYKYANKEVNVIKNDLTVMHVYEKADKQQKVADVILEIDDNRVNQIDDLKEVLKDKEEVKLLIKRDNKELILNVKTYKEDNTRYLGLMLTNVLELTTNPDIEYKYKSSESGSSGGLMNTLVIYNKLVSEDITKGKTIAGTGTMNISGQVGAIGGVKYKMLGARKADVFLIPSENYEEAKEIKEKYNLKFKLIEAKTFEGVLESLSNI